jgi:hypothetical protein
MTVPMKPGGGECEWFDECHNEATHLRRHRVLGMVPICTEHAMQGMRWKWTSVYDMPPIIARRKRRG